MFCDRPFYCSGLKFGRMIVLFMNDEGLAIIGNGWYCPSSCFGESTTPSPSLEASVLSRNSLVLLVKAKTGALMQACFKTWKTPKASSNGTFNKLPVVAHETKESMNLPVGLRQCTLSDGIHI